MTGQNIKTGANCLQTKLQLIQQKLDISIDTILMIVPFVTQIGTGVTILRSGIRVFEVAIIGILTFHITLYIYISRKRSYQKNEHH